MMTIAEIIGKPSIPPAEYASDVGCQRVNAPPDFPVYRIRKHCPECDTPFHGNSFGWQRDTDPPRASACDTCLALMERLEAQRHQREREEWERQTHRASQARRSYREASAPRLPED